MLALTRKKGEAIIIETSDGPVVVSVALINRDKVRLGIQAPQCCEIVRDELATIAQLDRAGIVPRDE